MFAYLECIGRKQRSSVTKCIATCKSANILNSQTSDMESECMFLDLGISLLLPPDKHPSTSCQSRNSQDSNISGFQSYPQICSISQSQNRALRVCSLKQQTATKIAYTYVYDSIFENHERCFFHLKCWQWADQGWPSNMTSVLGVSSNFVAFVSRHL